MTRLDVGIIPRSYSAHGGGLKVEKKKVTHTSYPV